MNVNYRTGNVHERASRVLPPILNFPSPILSVNQCPFGPPCKEILAIDVDQNLQLGQTCFGVSFHVLSLSSHNTCTTDYLRRCPITGYSAIPHCMTGLNSLHCSFLSPYLHSINRSWVRQWTMWYDIHREITLRTHNNWNIETKSEYYIDRNHMLRCISLWNKWSTSLSPHSACHKRKRPSF